MVSCVLVSNSESMLNARCNVIGKVSVCMVLKCFFPPIMMSGVVTWLEDQCGQHESSAKKWGV